MVNIYIVYGLGASSSHNNDPTLKNCLFGAVTLTKNADIDKYEYSRYGIGFDRKSSFSFPGGGFGPDIIIFGVDMSSSAHSAPLSLENISKDWSVDNKKKTGGYVYDFSVEYDANDVDDILKIHIYLMKKSSIVWIKMFGFVQKVFLK